MHLTTLVLSVLSSLTVAVPTTSVIAPPPASVRIRDVVYGGTGCPQGTLDVNVHKDGTAVSLDFGNEFTASIGGNAPITEQRKNCQVNFDLLFPPGYQYQVVSSEYSGYAALEKGVTGVVKSTYYFFGETDQDSTSLSIGGPYTGAYTFRSYTPLLVWSKCGTEALLNINSQIYLLNDKDEKGVLTADKGSTKFTQWVGIRWKKC